MVGEKGMHKLIGQQIKANGFFDITQQNSYTKLVEYLLENGTGRKYFLSVSIAGGSSFISTFHILECKNALEELCGS